MSESTTGRRFVPNARFKRLVTGISLRRLFSTFAQGLPGVGLLLMRVMVGTGVIVHAYARLASPSTGSIVRDLAAIAAGVLLLAGLWTPVSGWPVATLGLWKLTANIADPWADILLATVGATLALVGPGAWSVD